MNRFESITKPLKWFMALLLVAFVAGCSSGDGSSGPSPAKAITAYSLAWTAGTQGTATGTINETLKTIAVTVPFGTSKTAMKATFTSTGASVTVAGLAQVSGTTANDFTGSVAYKVTAADTTWATYTVNVTVASNTAKAIQTFTLAASGVASIGTVITEGATPKTIVVTVPYGTTNLTALVATFTTTGSSVKVGGTLQTTGTTPNDFSAASGVSAVPVAYVVTAADSSTATYNVTVTVALNSAKAITAFTLAGSGVASSGTVINEVAAPKTIVVTMPNGTNLTALVATYTATGASSVKVGGASGVVQTSGTTQNNFTAASGVSPTPVAYLVTAVDNSTATYNVTIAAAAGPAICTGVTGTVGNNCIDLKTAANYVILAESWITNVPTSAITGSIGLFPATGAQITGITCGGEVTGTIFSSNAAGPLPCRVTDGTGLNIGVGDKLAAYNDGFGRVVTTPGAYLNIGTPAGTLDATLPPLAPGVYVWTSGITIPVNLTLNGNATDVWILKVGGAVALNAQVLLTGGALPQNVFWIASGGVTVGTGSHIEGVVLSASDITMVTGSSAKGRLLSATQVILQKAIVTQP